MYVDYILGIAVCKTVEKVIMNTRRLEEGKKFRFSRKQSKYIVIKSRKGKFEEIKESVKERIIEMTDEYKYLGGWFSEANNIRRQLHTKIRVEVVIW